jgi:hypothetical protein
MKNLKHVDSPIVTRMTNWERAMWGEYPRELAGAFTIAAYDGSLHVIATSSDEWDHVSVSRADRTPTWEEMEQVKRLFFKDHEIAYQLHVNTKDHVNIHNNCLHIWRPHKEAIPLPPKEFV